MLYTATPLERSLPQQTTCLERPHAWVKVHFSEIECTVKPALKTTCL